MNAREEWLIRTAYADFCRLYGEAAYPLQHVAALEGLVADAIRAADELERTEKSPWNQTNQEG